MTWDWTNYVVGGGQRPDAISGLSPGFQSSLQSMFAAAPPEVQQYLRITSGYRSPEVQQRLWDEALAKYGSPEAARKWVAPPGSSQHNHGSAADLKYLAPEAQEWVHQNASQFGLYFPMGHEPWHIEPVGSRDGHAHDPASSNALAGAPGPQSSRQMNALAAMQMMQSMPRLQLNSLATEPYRMT